MTSHEFCFAGIDTIHKQHSTTGMFQKPRLSNGVSHRVFLMAGGHTLGVLSDNRGVSEICLKLKVENINV